MKLFGWIQTKLGGEENKPSTTFPRYNRKKLQETREEFSDWAHNLLAIGTLGSRQFSEQHPNSPEVTPQESLHVSSEEVGKLREMSEDLLPMDKFLNSPSMLELDKHASASFCTDEDVERMISLILGKCKDIWSDDKNSIGKKSVSFLLQKMFACRGGFSPAPSPRNILQESRMEKFLRTLLHKKMYPHNYSRAMPMTKTCIERIKEEEEETAAPAKTHIRRGYKWVRTNSDYIVLEM